MGEKICPYCNKAHREQYSVCQICVDVNRKELIRNKINQDIDISKRRKLSQEYARKTINCNPGYQRHHWSYHPDNVLDIIALPEDQHFKAHHLLLFDKTTLAFKSSDGVLLSTKDKHVKYLIDNGISI